MRRGDEEILDVVLLLQTLAGDAAAAAPLRAADDAIMIDTSDMDFDASRELLLDVIRGSVSN